MITAQRLRELLDLHLVLALLFGLASLAPTAIAQSGGPFEPIGDLTAARAAPQR